LFGDAAGGGLDAAGAAAGFVLEHVVEGAFEFGDVAGVGAAVVVEVLADLG